MFDLLYLLDDHERQFEQYELDMQFLERLQRDPEMSFLHPDWPDAEYCAEDIPHWIDEAG